MTVVLAVMCSDGVVIASDSQVTDSARGMTYPAQKLHDLGDHAAWGGSGARSVLGELEQIFNDSAAAILESEDVGRELQERVLPVLKHHYENFIEEIPGEETHGTPSAYVLAAGYSRGTPFIIEINPNAMVSRYDDIGFHAIGSGAPMAQQAGALLAHFQVMKRGVEYGVLTAIRVIDALALSSSSVGAEVDVARVTPDGARHLDENEIAEARENVRRWMQQEQRVLDQLFEDA